MAGKAAKAQIKSKSKSRLRVAVIGVGGMGNGHCKQITAKVPEIELVAVCDVDPKAAKTAGETYKVPYFLSHKDVIKSGLCDAVTIATPHPFHAPIAVDCMNAGLHVLSEKPISETVSGGEKMVKAAKKNKVAFAVMFQKRFQPGFRKAIEIAQSGILGRVLRATMIAPEYRSQAYYDSGTWRATWNGEGGGVMMNQAPHIIDIFLLLAGVPKSVSGKVDTRMHRIEVEDFAEASIQFKDGGTGYLYCTTNEPGPGMMLEVFGDKGKMTVRDGAVRAFQFETPVSVFTKTNKAMWGSPVCKELEVKLSEEPVGHFTVLGNFARHILKGEPLLCPGEAGLASLELANAITLSSYTGKEVKLPISRKAYDQLLARLRRTSTFKKKVAAQRVTDPAHVK